MTVTRADGVPYSETYVSHLSELIYKLMQGKIKIIATTYDNVAVLGGYARSGSVSRTEYTIEEVAEELPESE